MPLKKSVLYGIGIGPGDPELVTLKAINVLKRVDTIFAPFSTKNSYSLALNIIASYVDKDKEVVKLNFPMTKDKNELEDAWRRNAEIVIEHLKKGKECAFVTLGDPLTYSTFGYVSKKIRKMYKDAEIKVIPGITSYHASAALSNTVLVESEESFAVVSGAMGAKNLRSIVNHVDNVVVLKVYRHFDEIKETIAKLGLEDKCVLISRCGLDGEMVLRGLDKIDKENLSYLTLLIITKNRKQSDEA